MVNSPARAAVDVGSVIADTYRLEALLGRGGMGSVFLASHRRLASKRFAVKILHTELENTDVVARFRREAEIAARLNHPNIVGVIDYNVMADGTPYLVLDYLEGETLAQRIARGPVPLDRVLSIVRQVGSALAAAHRAGIIHRDLKPQNILLVPTEVDGRMVELAKVLDFGISKIRGSQTVKTQDSALLGTPQYMAPEQATAQHASIDERTDVFAFGAIVYEMLSGQPAFSGASTPVVMFKVVYEQPAPLAEGAPGVPSAIAVAVARAMAKAPGERFATVAEFVEAINREPLALASAGSGATRSRGAQVVVNKPPAPASPAPAKTTVDLHARDRAASPPHPHGVEPHVDTAGTTVRDHSAHAPPHRRSASAIAAIVLAVAAVAVGIMYVAMRDHAPVRADSGQGPIATVQPTTPPKLQPPVGPNALKGDTSDSSLSVLSDAGIHVPADASIDASISCTGGRVLASGHCCWSGQTFNVDKCDGQPKFCPQGFYRTDADCVRTWIGKWLNQYEDTSLDIYVEYTIQLRDHSKQCGKFDQDTEINYSSSERRSGPACSSHLDSCELVPSNEAKNGGLIAKLSPPCENYSNDDVISSLKIIVDDNDISQARVFLFDKKGMQAGRNFLTKHVRITPPSQKNEGSSQGSQVAP